MTRSKQEGIVETSNHAEGFNLDEVIARLKSAAVHPNSRRQVKSILQEFVSDPTWIAENTPEYDDDEVVLFEDDTVSIWHCSFTPGSSIPPHDHQMAATIGIYHGIERNTFFVENSDGSIRKSKSVDLSAGNVLQIGPDAIHAVECVSEGRSCGIHVYLGKLTTVERTLYDIERNISVPFTDENYQHLIQYLVT